VPFRYTATSRALGDAGAPDSAILIDATMKHAMPPLRCRKREYMGDGRALWERLGRAAAAARRCLSATGYSLGDWTTNGPRALQRRQSALDGATRS